MRRILTAAERVAVWHTATAKWYHTSDHYLPVGTRLIPGGGSSIYDDWYEEEGLEDNKDYVWLEPTLPGVIGWAGPNSHVYEVKPEEEPHDQGGGGWTTSGAKITKYLGIGKDLGVEMTGPEHTAALEYHSPYREVDQNDFIRSAYRLLAQVQLALVGKLYDRTVSPGNTPDLRHYDLILVNSSAGKDSQAALDVIAKQARELGVLDRVKVVHADLGQAEWPDTLELAKKQADHYGLPFISVSRPQGDLLQHIEDRARKNLERYQRGEVEKPAPAFPDSSARYCTSDHKTGQISKIMTQLTRELRESGKVTGRPVRILNALGIRAEESPDRAKKIPYRVNHPSSNTLRQVDEWYPIHDWKTADVWNRIKESGVPHHWAYDKGMRRLSCRFCPLASHDDLVLSARLNPELAQKYVELENRIKAMGVPHRFQNARSMAEIVKEAEALGPVEDDYVRPGVPKGCPRFDELAARPPGGGCDGFEEDLGTGDDPPEQEAPEIPSYAGPVSLGLPRIPIRTHSDDYQAPKTADINMWDRARARQKLEEKRHQRLPEVTTRRGEPPVVESGDEEEELYYWPQVANRVVFR